MVINVNYRMASKGSCKGMYRKEMPDLEAHVKGAELRVSLRCFQHGDLGGTAGDNDVSACKIA